MEKRYRWLLLGIVLVGTCLRMPITSIPPLLDMIQQSFQLPASLLGSLTTIPLLCFALLSPLAPQLARRWGNELTILVALVFLTIGDFVRGFSAIWLLIGTLCLGVGIAVMNVLVPAVIADHFPQRIGGVTSMYTFAMTLFSAIGAGFSVPLAKQFGWQPIVQILAFIAGVIALLWVPNLRLNHRLVKSKLQQSRSVWQMRGAWIMTITMGIQSLLFYTVLTWLPKIMTSRGVPQTTSGLMLGLFQLAALPAAYLVPNIAAKAQRQSRLIWVICITFALGLAGLIIPSRSLWYLGLLCMLLGLASTGAFGLCMTLFSLKTTTAAETAAISGMAQAAGYLLAAIGPVSFGVIYGALHSWTLLLIILIILDLGMLLAGLAVERRKTVFD
ncbi:CynX/NimT family MFS transporter [Loigolactobacillus binensis]|uniref:CynX/NimT family MFS transporter n=1 Tax=Loigolactobacillus binensis TaxID=2559922 RepID=A0ABW3EHR0_9LACO|nr:MFS transporter [Loigolactobacillus binensis]